MSRRRRCRRCGTPIPAQPKQLLCVACQLTEERHGTPEQLEAERFGQPGRTPR